MPTGELKAHILPVYGGVLKAKVSFAPETKLTVGEVYKSKAAEEILHRFWFYPNAS